jgi:hypothetical protein
MFASSSLKRRIQATGFRLQASGYRLETPEPRLKPEV